MYLRYLQIRDVSDVDGYLAGVARVERLRGALDARGFGSDLAPTEARSVAAALRLAGRETVEDEPAARGYADVLKLLMAHASELPFAESQIKYFHSQLLRHDAAAAGHRRRYREAGDAVEGGGAWSVGEPLAGERVAAEMARLVAWTKETLDAGAFYPLLPVGVFLGRFLGVRPFASGNTRLALALASYFLDRCGYAHVRAVPFEEILAERSAEGAEALAVMHGDREDATPWVRYLLDAVAESQRRALELAAPVVVPEAVAAPPPAPAPAPVPVLPLHPRLSRVLDVMRERQAAKIGELLETVGSPRATLKKDLRALVDAGHLVSRGVRKGTVYYLIDSSRRS